MRDPMLVDEIVDILAPHSRGCQDMECTWCDTAIGQAGEIALVVRAALLDVGTVEVICRAFWPEWDTESEENQQHLRNHWLQHLGILADVLVPVPVAELVEQQS